MDVALLAPVPRRHLESGLEKCASAGMVAFGSRDWLLFRQLSTLCGNSPVTAYLYASHTESLPLPVRITWLATFIHSVEDNDRAAFKEALALRPASAATDTDWPVLWLVKDLQLLPPDQHISITAFNGYGQWKPYRRNFIPEGPLLVEVL